MWASMVVIMAAVLANSGLADLFEENKMGVPEPKAIEGCSLDTVPYFLVRWEVDY